jgi:hypothetical protein
MSDLSLANAGGDLLQSDGIAAGLVGFKTKKKGAEIGIDV